MNMKFSTLFTASLLMAGSVFGSAHAESIKSLVHHESPADKVEAGSQYVMVQTFNDVEYVYGLKLKSDGTFEEVIEKIDNNIDSEDLKDFAWSVEETLGAKSAYTYKLKNVGVNSYLRVKSPYDAETADEITEYSVALDPSENKAYIVDQFVFPDYVKYSNTGNQWLMPHSAKIEAQKAYQSIQFYDGSTISGEKDELQFELTDQDNIKFYKIESSEVKGEALNKLYNSKGFSFAVKSDAAVVENPFQNLRAIELTTTVNAKEDENTWGFPEGTYFVTKESYEATKKAKGDYNPSWADERKFEFLRSLTFIAVSSTQSIEVTGVDRANGQGFELVQISGNDLYDYIGTDLDKLPQNNQLSVKNACFHVEGLSTNSYPYSIKVKEFYFVADADALATANGKGEDYDQTKKEVNLEVLKHGSPAAYYLTTSKSTANAAPFIFKFDESNIEKGISFLKADGPAVYNIRFVSGSNDQTERGKYLTVGFGDKAPVAPTTLNFLAKGEALADADALATPAYQFVITNVKGNDVTFTNRESGVEFTAKLYKEREENGKTIYSLSSDNNNNVYIVNINSNSYGTTIASKPVNLNNVEIELLESSVDANSGYLNVADGTLMTIKYARDAHSTSNLWYAAVKDVNGDDVPDMRTVTGRGGNALLSNDLNSAAQWQLVKVSPVVDLDRDYAYNNANVVAIKGYGDKLKAYRYKLRYVTDGTATEWYMTGESNAVALDKTGSEYIIRKNPNGSVSLVEYNSFEVPFNNAKNAFSDNANETILELNTTNNTFNYSEAYIYDAARTDSELLTFLVNESPEISWKAEEGHVTIQSAGGDFLTMAENNDAIIVNEANADKLYLHVDKKGNGIIPSFYISKGYVKGSNSASERMFLYNPIDSVEYQVNMKYDPRYQLAPETTKAVFKSGILNETRDTLSLTVKGEVAKKVAAKSNNQQNVWAGLNRFQFQIVETEEGDATYYIRQPKANKDGDATCYLANANDKAVWVEKGNAVLPPYTFVIEDTTAPTSNETVAASEVKVVAQDGAVVVKNAAGKNVVVSTILGQVVANEVLTSDNATINVPAGIVVVAVEGESFKVNVK